MTTDGPSDLYGPDGLHEWLEDLHRSGRERMESSVLAHLLRHPEYRRAFLSACGIDWPEGAHAAVRCEVPIDGGGVADLDVQWHTQNGARRLLIEHKPWAPFTYAQPANYIRQLKVDDAHHAAFVLLVGDGGKVDIARRRLLQSRIVPSAPSGASWSTIEEHLRAEYRSRWMKHRPIHKVVGALRSVQGPPLHRALVHFWFSRQPLEPLLVPADDKGRVEALLHDLRLVEAEPYEDKQRYGVYLHWKGAVRHTELVWFGVAPPVATQLGVPTGSIVVVRGGQLPAPMTAALVAWAAAHALSWTPVEAGTRVAEWAVALDETTSLDALGDLATRMKLRRRRGKT